MIRDTIKSVYFRETTPYRGYICLNTKTKNIISKEVSIFVYNTLSDKVKEGTTIVEVYSEYFSVPGMSIPIQVSL